MDPEEKKEQTISLEFIDDLLLQVAAARNLICANFSDERSEGWKGACDSIYKRFKEALVPFRSDVVIGLILPNDRVEFLFWQKNSRPFDHTSARDIWNWTLDVLEGKHDDEIREWIKNRNEGT